MKRKLRINVLVVAIVGGMLLHGRPAQAGGGEAELVLYVLGAAVAGPVCLTGSAICLAADLNCPNLGKCSAWSSFAWIVGGIAAAAVFASSDDMQHRETAIAISSGAAALGVAMAVVGGFCWARSSDEDEVAVTPGGLMPVVVETRDGGTALGLGLHFGW